MLSRTHYSAQERDTRSRAAQLLANQPFVRGSLVLRYRTCGKSYCRCQRGQKHPALYLYTGGLSISNMFEKLGRFWTTLIASVFGIILSAIPDVLNSYLQYATLLGNFFSPIAGVLVFDYIILKRTKLDVPSLFTMDGR